VQDINALLSQFREAQKMMKQLSTNPRLRAMAGVMGGNRRRK
jgi:signal recognition particle GTPase